MVMKTQIVTFICVLNSHLVEDHELIQARPGAPSSSSFINTRHRTFHIFFVRVDFSSLSECITFRGSKAFDLWLPKQAKEKEMGKLIEPRVSKPLVVLLVVEQTFLVFI